MLLNYTHLNGIIKIKKEKKMNRYYDPEYDRFVEESVILAQFEYFKNEGMCTNYKEFKENNFIPEEKCKCLNWLNME